LSARDVDALAIVTKVIAEALESRAKRRDLIANPKEVLEKAGMQVPPRVKVVVHENKKNEIHLVLPSTEVAELDLEKGDARLLGQFWPY
jgi:hypothetical protein